MRKYLFSGAILGALFGAIGLVARTIAGPRNVRILIAWAGWLLGFVSAVIAVREESNEASEYYELRDAERARKNHSR